MIDLHLKLGKTLDTRYKLQEAKYFLDTLLKTKHGEEPFYYNLSAFLSAWKSVFEIMLYDLAEHYSIGLTRKDKMYPHDFWIVAYAQKHSQALQFYKWWSKKRENELPKNPLWYMRPEIVHRGYPEIPGRIVYTSDPVVSGATSYIQLGDTRIGTIPGATIEIGMPMTISTHPRAHKGVLEVDFSEVLEICKEGYTLMESIVTEAENEFKVEL